MNATITSSNILIRTEITIINTMAVIFFAEIKKNKAINILIVAINIILNTEAITKAKITIKIVAITINISI